MEKLSSPAQKIIVGIDEAGRGPLAGPVVAAAFTIVNPKFESRNSKQIQNYNSLNLKHVSDFVLRASHLKLRDSKLLSAIQRERIYAELHRNPEVEWGIGQVSEKVIDRINIFQATRLAMKKAVQSLERKMYEVRPRTSIELLIIDGNMLLDLPISQKAIVKADATIFQCMAASIIAKVTRDRLMLKYHKRYPVYGFDRHKGYGTTFHFEALKRYGVSPIHRRSFSPIRQMINF